MHEFVSVPVPVERVQEVYELLARQPVRPSGGHQVSDDGYPSGWSQALIERMIVESSSAVRRILCAIATKSPSWVSTHEIAVASGLTDRQVIASLGPLGKRVRGRYAMSLWPFETRQFVDAGIRKYSMSPETANRILELTTQVEEHESGSK
jgi:hypothetical protein